MNRKPKACKDISQAQYSNVFLAYTLQCSILYYRINHGQVWLHAHIPLKGTVFLLELCSL